MIKGIIFDFNGTLAYKTKSISRDKFAEMLRSLGYDIYHQEWEAAYLYTFHIEFPKGNIKTFEDFYREVLKHFNVKPTASDMKKIIKYHKENDRHTFYPDTKYIKDLNVKKAILTTIPRFRFDYLDLKQFDPVFTGVEIGRSKPHPDGFLKILKIWKLKPEEVLMVGDNPGVDIIPAKKLGMQTAFINRDGEKYPGADYNIKSLKELKEIVEK